MDAPIPLDASREFLDEEVEARRRWARRAGHPGWVWPEVQRPSWREGLRALERVAREVLGGAGLAHIEAAPAEQAGVAVAAYSSGLGPLLGAWAEEGTLDCDPALRRLFALHLEHGRRRRARLVSVAGEAIDRLAAVGVEPIVLKGLHTAAVFPDPGARLCNDVDFAVPRVRWTEAREALERGGYELLTDQPRLGRAEYLAPGEARSPRSLLLLHERAPIRVDLHAGLDRIYFGAGRLALGDGEADDSRPAPELAPSARVLREPLLTLLLAAHASEGLHNLTLLRMVELVLVIRAGRKDGALDWDALLARARSAGSPRFLFPALELTERLVSDTVPASIRRALRAEAPLAMRAVVDALEPATTQRIESVSLAERLMWAGSPRELAGRLLDMARPASVGEDGGMTRVYVERLWRVLRGRVSVQE